MSYKTTKHFLWIGVLRDYIFISVLPHNLRGAVGALQYSVKCSCSCMMYAVHQRLIFIFTKNQKLLDYSNFFFSLWLNHTARATVDRWL